VHLICVYTEDYTDIEDVIRVERELRSLGITEALFYKPDIYTYLNIYSNNRYHLNASVYTSAGTTCIDMLMMSIVYVKKADSYHHGCNFVGVSMELEALGILADFTRNAVKDIQTKSYFG